METILVVDDNPFVLNTITLGLRHAGFTVLEAASPAEALEVGTRYCDPIHLIILDVILPSMDGPDLAEQFLERHPECRCLFVSGLPDTPRIAKQIHSRGLPFLAKPFLPQALAKKVRAVLDMPGVHGAGA